MMARESLHCERGNHMWDRQSARGRKPKVCNSPLCAETPHPDLAESHVETSTGPSPTTPNALSARLSGAERGRILVERMRPLVERDANRRKPKPPKPKPNVSN